MNVRCLGGSVLGVRSGGVGIWVMLGLMIGGWGAAAEPAGKEEARLRKQVEWLAESLASARAEVDVLRARLDRAEYERAGGGRSDEKAEAGASLAGVECSVLDVNEELGMAVVNAGRRRGVRPGMSLGVLRQGKVVAKLRVVDVRTMIAGAVIEREGRESPGRNDRVVLAAGSKE